MVVHLTILVFLVLINLIPEKRKVKKKYILPFSYLVIFVYWAIRYDYGLDYWNYYKVFYSDVEEHIGGFGEIWFYAFFRLFEHYYQAVIAESFIIVMTLYHLTRKYIPQSYYWLFFFLLFAVSGLHFNLISAMRSSFAACILFWAFDLFVIEKKRWIPFMGMVFGAAMFHSSTLAFLLTPLVYESFNKMRGKVILIILLVADILSMFYVNRLFNWAINLSVYTADYDYYASFMNEASFMGVIYKSIILYPTYFITCMYDRLNKDKHFRSICILAFFHVFINMIGLNFHDRFTVYLFPFYMIALAQSCLYFSKEEKRIMLIPYLLFIVYGLVVYYNTLLLKIHTEWSIGNPFYYHTLFDAPSLP